MSKTYIDRDAVLQKRLLWIENNKRSVPVVMVEDIETIPAADVEEVQHAKNIAKDYADCDQFVCEKCGIELQGWYRVERDVDDGGETHYEYVFRYCPNCGAKMDGGVNDAAD